MKKFFQLFGLITALTVGNHQAKAAIFTWNGGDGNWNDPLAWTVSGAPSLSTFPGEAVLQEDTVVINSSGTVTINASFNNSSVKNFTLNSGIVLGNAITGIINGDLDIAAGATFNINAATITVQGFTNIEGTLSDGSNTGINSFVGAISIGNTGVFSTSNNSAYNFSGGITGDVLATVNLDGSGAKSFTVNNQIINLQNPTKINSAEFVRINNLRINAGITLQNNGYLQVGDIQRNAGAVLATFINNTNAVLYTYNTVTPFTDVNVTFNFTALNNAVNYNRNGGDQTIRATTYRNLVVSNYGNTGDRIKSLTGVTIVNGKLIVEGNCADNRIATLQLASNNITVADSTIINCRGILTDNLAAGNNNFQSVTVKNNGLINFNLGSNFNIAQTLLVESGGLVRDDNLAGVTNTIFKTRILNGGTFDLEQATLTFTDSVWVEGTLSNSNAAGAVIFAGHLRVLPNGVYNSTTAENFTFRRGIHFEGTTFNSGAGTFTFNTNAQNISGKFFTLSGAVVATSKLRILDSLRINGNVSINMADSIRNHGVVYLTSTASPSLNGSVAGARWFQRAGSELHFAGTTMFGTGQLAASSPNNMVNYYRGSGDQTIYATTYFNLQVSNPENSGNRTKALGTGTTTVSNKLTLEGNCLNARQAILQLAGNTINVADSTIINCQGILTDNATAGNNNFQSVRVRNSGTINFSQGSNFNIAQTLLVESGGLVRDDNVAGVINTIFKTRILSGGTFDLEQATLTFTDSVWVEGTLSNSNVAGAVIFAGHLRVLPNGVYNSATAENFTFRRGIHFDGTTFNSGAGTYTFNTNAQNISGKFFTLSGAVVATSKLRILDSLRINGNVSINMADSIRNHGVVYLTSVATNALNGSVAAARWFQRTGSELHFAGQTMFTTGQLAAASPNNLVNYYRGSGDQTILATTYFNLQVSNPENSGNRTKSLGAGTTTVSNKLTLEGNCLNARQAILQLAGNTINVADSTIINCQGILTDNATAGNNNFQSVRVRNSGTINFSQGSNFNIAQTLLVESGGLVRDDNVAGVTNTIFKTRILNGGTFDLEQATLTFTDSVWVEGTLSNSNAAGAVIFAGHLRVLPNGVYNSATAENFTFRRGIHFNGTTFNSGAGTYTFNTNAQDISGKFFTLSGAVTATTKLRILDSLQINGIVNINMADSIRNHGVVYLTSVATNALNGNVASARWFQVPGSKLFYQGETMFGTNGQLAAEAGAGNEVHYNRAGIQTIGTFNYANLIISGSGTKTQAGNIAIGENVSITGGSATLDQNTFTLNRITLGGIITIDNGNTLIVRNEDNYPKNFTTQTLGANSTVNYNRSINANQNVAPWNYGNLLFSNNNIAAAKTLAGNTTVRGTFTPNGINGGRLSLNGFEFSFGTDAVVSGTLNNNNFIDMSAGGAVTRFVDAPQSFTFNIGHAATHLPAKININSATLSGAPGSRFVRIGTVASAEPNQLDTTYSLRRYYTLNGFNLSNLTGSFRFSYRNADLPPAVTPAIEAEFVTGFWNGSNYTVSTSAQVDETADTATISFTGTPTISGNYTTALLTSFLPQRFFSRVAVGNWEDASTWSLTGHTGAAYVVPPTLNSRVFIGNANNVTITGSGTKFADTLNIYAGARLNIATFHNSLTINRFLNTSGTGTLATEGLPGDTARFPTVNILNSFSTSINRINEFTGSNSYFIPRQITAYRGLNISGSGVKRLTANITATNTTVNTGSTLFMEQYSISASGAIFTMAAGSTLRVGNPSLATAVIFPTGFSTYTLNATSTVNYAANGNQSIRALTYGNLSLSTSGSKTLLGSIVVAGNLDVGATTTLSFGTTLRTATVTGNLSGTGTIDMTAANHELYLRGASNAIGTLNTSPNNSLIVYDRLGNQDIFPSPNYRLLRTSGSNAKTINGTPLTAQQTNVQGTSILTINANNLQANLGTVLIDATGEIQCSGQNQRIQTSNLTTNGRFIYSPVFTTASSNDTLQINGNLTVSSSASARFQVSNFAGAQRATGTMRINITGNVATNQILEVADNTQVRLSGNWINNNDVIWNAFEGRYPKVWFVRSSGFQLVENGLGFNNFPEVEIAQGTTAKVELLRDMRIGSHFTLTSGTFFSGQEVGGSQSILVTGEWRSNGGVFNAKSSTTFFEGAALSNITTTAGTPHNSGTNFYNLSITKTGTGLNRIVQSSTNAAVTVRVRNNFSVLSGTYRIRNRLATPSDTDLVVNGDVFVANNACLDITAGSPTSPALHAEAADIHLYIAGDLTDQNLDANLFGNNSNGFYMGGINADNAISNKPTIHFCGVNTTQTVRGFSANCGSRGGAFTGLTLPNVEIDGVNTTLTMGSALRHRGYTRIRKTNKMVVAGQAYGFYGFLINDGAVATSPPFNYFLALRVDSGAVFEAEPGANIFIHPRSKVFADTNSTLQLVGTFNDPISFIRDGLASGQRHSHEYHGNVSARFVRYQVGDAGGNINILTNQCGANISPNLYLSQKVNLAAFPNNFSNSDFASVGATIGLWIDAPLTIGLNDTLVGCNFGGNPSTFSCSRTLGLAIPVVFKNSGGVRGGSIFGPAAECDSSGPAPTRAITGRVRWSSSSTLRWTGDVSTNWFEINNWIPTQVPSRLDIVEIPTGRYRYPILTGNATAGRLNVGLISSTDPLVAPIGTIQNPGVSLASHTLDMVGDSLNLFGDVEIGNIIGGGTNAFINLGSGRLRLQGNLICSQNVTVAFNDTVRGIIPNTGTIEFYSGKNATISMASLSNDAPGIWKLFNLEISKETGALQYGCAAKMLVNNLKLTTGSFRHGTCADGSPLFLTGSMDISPGAFHDNRGEIVQFISTNKAVRTIRTGGNVYRRFFLRGGVGARYVMQDSLSVNTAASASLQIHRADTLITNGNTIIARNLEVSDADGSNAMLWIDANGTLLMNTGGTVTVSPNSRINIIGDNTGFATVNCLTTGGNYAFTVNGTLRAKNYLFERLNANGLNISGGTIDNSYLDNLSFGIFDYGAQRASNDPAGPARYITFNSNVLTGINYLFKDVAFSNSSNRTPYLSSNAATGTLTLANVGVGNLAGTGTNRYTFENPSGALGSTTARENEYDNPAFSQSTGFIRWIKNGIRWNGTTNNSWHVASNWSSGTVPTANDNVVLSHRDRAGAYTVNITAGPAVCRSLLIVNSNEGTGNALGTMTLNVSGNNLDVKKDITLSSGAASVINLSGNRNLLIGTSFFNSGTFNAATNSTVTFYGDGQRQLGITNLFNLSIVDSGSANNYTLTGNTVINGALTIGPLSSLDVTSSNYALNLRGNINPSGDFKARGGTVFFEGNNAQRINGNITFNRFYIDKNAENVYVPKHKLRINELAFFIEGRIRTSWIYYPVDPIAADTMGEVEIGENGEIAQASSNSFVDGRLTLNYRSSAIPVLKTFHIGKQNANGYTAIPLRVRLASPTPTRIRGEVFTFFSGANVPFTNQGNYPTCALKDSGWGHGIDHLSGIRYWQFDKLDPTAVDSARVTLPWNVNDLVFVPGNLAIFKGDGTCLDMLNNTYTEAIGTPLAGTITSTKNFTTFSPFIFGTDLPWFVNPLPLDLITFKGNHNADKMRNELKWTTVNENQVSHFEVEASKDGTTFKTIGSLQARNNQRVASHYYFEDTDVHQSTYYRLKMVDQNGETKHSQVVHIRVRGAYVDAELVFYPNPANDKLFVQSEGLGKLTIRDITGRIMLEKEITESQTLPLDVSQFAKGMYLMEWQTESERFISRFMKQ